MKRYLYGGVTLLAIAGALGVGSRMLGKTSGEATAPKFEVDPLWPKPLPNHWRIGMTIGVAIDPQDHVWVIHRPKSIVPGELHAEATPPMSECCIKAPPVIEFDKEGNVIGSWGGPGQGYDWPISEHGITIDYKGNVWVGGNGGVGSDPEYKDTYHDNHILKFTAAGKFLLQIGKPLASKGSNDPDNVKGVAQTFIDPKTNEMFVADGYGNHRVVVYDADSGKKVQAGTGALTARGRTTPILANTIRMRRPVNNSPTRSIVWCCPTTTCCISAIASTTASRCSNQMGLS